LRESETLRNALGIQEVEYDEAEKVYNLEEWRYTAKEAEFIDGLPGSARAPSQPDTSYQLFDGYEHFARPSLGPQHISHIEADSNGDMCFPFCRPEAATGREDGLSEGQSTVPGDIHQQSSIPNAQRTTGIEDSKAYPTNILPFEEPATSDSRLKWAETRMWIDAWLLSSLDSSALEEERLRHSIFGDENSDKDWWKIVEQYWFLDMPTGSGYHTGDTTVSDEIRSDNLSSNALRKLFEASDKAESMAQEFSSMPLLAQDRGLDALDLTDFPKNIEPGDMLDHSPRHVTAFGRPLSTHSRSTHSKMLTRVSSRLDCSSISTVEERTPDPRCGRESIGEQKGSHCLTDGTRGPQSDNKPETGMPNVVLQSDPTYRTCTTKIPRRTNPHVIGPNQPESRALTYSGKSHTTELQAGSETGFLIVIASQADWSSSRARKQYIDGYEP
jgi:hypothetical protein